MRRSWVAAALVIVLFGTTGGGVLGTDPAPGPHPRAGWTGYVGPVPLGHSWTFQTENDDSGWLMFQVDVQERTAMRTRLARDTTSADARIVIAVSSGVLGAETHLVQFGGGGTFSREDSCDLVQGETHLDDCPLQRFAFAGHGGGTGGILAPGLHTFYVAAYGSAGRLTAELTSALPVQPVWTAEGPTRLLPLTPARGTPAGPADFATTFHSDKPFLAEPFGFGPFHPLAVHIHGPHGSSSIHSFGGFEPHAIPGAPGAHTVKVQGILEEEDDVAGVALGIMIGVPFVGEEGTVAPFGRVNHDPPIPSSESAPVTS